MSTRDPHQLPTVPLTEPLTQSLPEPPLKTLELRIAVDEHDLPEDRYSDHVNNARYFAFINRTFQAWYRPMGLRDRSTAFVAAMVRSEYDFLAEVKPPGEVMCRITVVRVGRASMEHAVEMWDMQPRGQDAPALVGRGKIIHACIDRATRRAMPWPQEIRDRCWRDPQQGTDAG
jgi:acyl-CoA thioester hydrolase